MLVDAGWQAAAALGGYLAADLATFYLSSSRALECRPAAFVGRAFEVRGLNKQAGAALSSARLRGVGHLRVDDQAQE